ncbi:unnamed protein product [Psylliodes chrysocephalus]|uniref:Uncharacterized protein n=1 Tax=Psylliodes chrysocephalus TaxID=3402493 RepID=A0A9P0CF90_9CUCU|nr:unnamed protein product [Psylliodes chrysocephala]
MSDTDDTQFQRSVEETKKKKRGVRNDENYKRNVIKKRCRVQGKAYINYSENAVNARKLGDECRDNCLGQNKNHTMIRMCTASVETNRYKKVEQFFPIKEHSFLPNNRDFGVIKRRLKRSDRIFSVHEYTEIIIASKTPGYVMCSEFIGGLTDHTYKIHMPRNVERVPVRMPEKNPHQEKVPILETKITDFGKEMSCVPEEYHPFYQEILEWPTKVSKKEEMEFQA